MAVVKVPSIAIRGSFMCRSRAAYIPSQNVLKAVVPVVECCTQPYSCPVMWRACSPRLWRPYWRSLNSLPVVVRTWRRQQTRNYSSGAQDSNPFIKGPDSQSRGYAKAPAQTTDQPLTGTIESFLKKHEVKYLDGHTCFIVTCPRYKKFKSDADRLFINKTTGHFICRSCKKSGKWAQLQDNISILLSEMDKKKRIRNCFKEVEPDALPAKVTTAIQSTLKDSKAIQEFTSTEQEELVKKFDVQGLSLATLEKYQVRVSENQDSLIFPCHSSDGTTKGLKVLTASDGDDGHVTVSRHTVPSGESTFLFGWSTIATKTKEVILTTNELDALAAHQETKLPALSLSGQSSLPQEVLPLLEQFQKIILWFGNDISNWDAAKMFSKKLGESRCHLVRPSSDKPSALAALKGKLKLSKIVTDAQPTPHKSIVSFKELRQEVLAQFTHAEQAAGVKWKRYPRLNQLLKGHRRGELTVFTGPTGSGKTTFISDYSLDLCLQGVHTLWGSFEISNVRLCRMMLQQYSRKNLYKNMGEFKHYADAFESLPMHFMTFHGEENFKKVIDTMSHAVYVHDIAHVIVDNLQFMMGVDRYSSMGDRFYQQEVIIGAFRRFSTHLNCHVTLVIHPRKEDDESLLSKSSIFGSAKASQEADNIMILQDQTRSITGKKFVQVVKNRYDGELGSLILKFDKESLGFSGGETKPKSSQKQDPES